LSLLDEDLSALALVVLIHKSFSFQYLSSLDKDLDLSALALVVLIHIGLFAGRRSKAAPRQR